MHPPEPDLRLNGQHHHRLSVAGLDALPVNHDRPVIAAGQRQFKRRALCFIVAMGST
jgi:hypothetical protein